MVLNAKLAFLYLNDMLAFSSYCLLLHLCKHRHCCVTAGGSHVLCEDNSRKRKAVAFADHAGCPTQCFVNKNKVRIVCKNVVIRHLAVKARILSWRRTPLLNAICAAQRQ